MSTMPRSQNPVSTPRCCAIAILVTVLVAFASEAAPPDSPASSASPTNAAPAQTAAPAGDAPATDSNDGVTQLPGVTIERKRRNVFEESDRKLRELIEGATPCLGCDVKKAEVPPSIVKQAIDIGKYLITPQSSQPKDHDADQQEEVDRSVYEQRHPSNSNP